MFLFRELNMNLSTIKHNSFHRTKPISISLSLTQFVFEEKNKMPESLSESCLFRVGYALPTRKIEAFMVPSFVNYAKERNIDFISIDISKPLIEQGPFDCIIHKLYDDEWNLNLESFAITSPNVTIIDHPTNIQRLYNRITMLEPVSKLKIPKLNIPTQILIQDSQSLIKISPNHKRINFSNNRETTFCGWKNRRT